MRRRWGVLAAPILLGGCATQPPIQPHVPAVADLGESRWRARQSSLRTLDAWTIEGRIALYNDAEAWNADLHWRQQSEDYDIRLVGPFGLGRVRVRGNADGVAMETSDGRYRERNPDTLFNQRLGWNIPVTGLKWWIRGLPSVTPPSRSRPTPDRQGRLRTLDQDGWHIRFIDYVAIDGLELPGKVFLENEQWKVRLVIGNWRLQPG